MKRATILALVVLAAASVTASAASRPPEEVVANLVTGHCFSEKTGAPLPAGSIDPRKVGTPLTPRDRLARLSRAALRIPTGSGNVYHDDRTNYCYVHASNIDPARTIARLESELKQRGLRFDRAPVRSSGKSKGGDRDPDLILIINVPLSNPKVPVITITYDDDPSVVSIGVAVGG